MHQLSNYVTNSVTQDVTMVTVSINNAKILKLVIDSRDFLWNFYIMCINS